MYYAYTPNFFEQVEKDICIYACIVPQLTMC